MLFSTFSTTIFAQKTVSVKTEQPQTSVGKKNVLQNYIDISSLTMNKRPKVFNELSAQDKANLFRFHLALQFIKRPNLSKEQKDVILDGILITTSETYSKESPDKIAKTQQENGLLEARAKVAFLGQEGFEIFASLSGDNNDVQNLQKYQLVTAFKYQVERRAAFSNLSIQEKSNTMRIHLALQMANRSLNKEQNEFIVEAMSLINPSIYGVKKGMDEWNKIHESLNFLKDRMMSFFPKEEAFEIFASLGGEKGSTENTEELAPNCSCSGSSDYCGWWRSGASCGGGSCRFQVGGCGTGLWYDCDGMCTGGV